MVKHLRKLLFLTCLLPLWLSAQEQEIAIIPRPVKVLSMEGELNLNQKLDLYYTEEFSQVADLVNEIPGIHIGNSELVKKIKKQHQSGIRLFKAEEFDRVDPNGYLIEVDEHGILVKAHSPQAMIPGIYSLVQLSYLNDSKSLPYVRIEDKPRFPYRGMHLDVSRNFMPFNFLKKYIDLLALYKFNYFHWHITDGAGWRLEIKQYPELTKKAAWRTHTLWKDWWNNGRQYVDEGTPNASGGYYTQNQARELVAYAAKRGITIIPEIEMPGHSEEVLAVYPELSCTGIPYTQGEFCLGNEDTYKFLKNVLDEVMAIFPSQYIHIGGDEADKSHWKNCPKCQALMKRDSLKSEEELQSYAIKQMDEYLQSKGRKLIGWDEILEGGLTPGATVMSWRGEEGGIKSANAGHDVIMTPGAYLYFDGYQTDPRTQPEALGGFLPLEKVYSYNPIPEGIQDDKKKHILGAQANVWTEHIPTYQHVEYMAFPRALALSEVVWTDKDSKSWPDFQKRLQQQYKILQKLEVNYYRPSYNVINKVEFDSAQVKNTISLSSEQFKPYIRYTIDGTEPSKSSTLYNLPIELSKSAVIKAASFLDSARVSPVETIELDIHKAIGKEVIYKTPWEGYPAQGNRTLTNGIKGTLTYQDGQWQGFTKGVDVIVDFERREEIKSVALNFMQIPAPGVYFPGEFTVLVSDNGKSYRELGTVKNQVSTTDPALKFQKFEIKLEKPIMARYIQIKATNPMKGYLFADEIVIY
ncbi:Beta-hexosaminidase [Sphingobacterium mizutaii]|uniref:beta-N-acetylhexosaminidase n=2 Tax=Sphingobacterium mizutaii TaxID=1010 RepID=A0AAJ4XEU5_9SPHI|nr:family 20 glycosylhydrolase [Sphingobacterium mizutaii]SDL68969.1 hexosaminidase [Sphingobacterium mizutaii]SNV58435.1 Beta-hexosaminidase [Sphingobacterium mizutaii]